MRAACLFVVAVAVAGCQCGEAPGAPLPLEAQRPAGRPEPARTSAPPSADRYAEMIARLAPLHEKKRKPQDSDWLAEHDEGGQTFAQYLKDDPVLPDLDPGKGKRSQLYVQPLGPLTPSERKLVELTSEFMRRVFSLPVKVQADLSLDIIPEDARRRHPSWGTPQILTTHVLDNLLLPRLPEDAAAYIALTASDLWPGKGWNFVFGQASLRERVGVWSLHRYGDPSRGPKAFKLALLRTLKVAVHETGHMFSLEHCTAYECVMGGSNNLEETDRAPLWLCPECLAKIAWATRSDPRSHYRALASFALEHGLTEEAAFFQRSLEALDR